MQKLEIFILLTIATSLVSYTIYEIITLIN